MARYDILPSKDMQKVKKDLKDIKTKLSKKKTKVQKKKTYKVLPHKDIVEVKKNLKEIKTTLDKKALADKPVKRTIKATRFDNYYDMLPHKKVKELELQLTTLKGKLKKSREKTVSKERKNLLPKTTKQLLNSMSKLDKTIASLVKLFEKADQTLGNSGSEPVALSAAAGSLDLTPLNRELSEIKGRLEELSAENEEMAKGILVIAEMLKENPPEIKPDSDTADELGAMLLNKEGGPKKDGKAPRPGAAFESFYKQQGQQPGQPARPIPAPDKKKQPSLPDAANPPSPQDK